MSVLITSDGQTPSYYPPGWDRKRLLDSEQEELFALPSEQLDRLREGLKEDLGPQGFQTFLEEVGKRYQARHPAAAEEGDIPPTISPPNFLLVLERQYSSQPWGFVVFRAAAYTDQDQWIAFQKRWEDIVIPQIDEYKKIPGVAEAKQNLQFQWVENPTLENATMSEIARRYRALSAPSGLKHSLCLAVTSSSLSSVLNSPRPSSAPRHARKMIPFVVAIDEQLKEVQGGEEGDDIEDKLPTGHFNVAVETLLEELFPLVGDQSVTPWEIGGLVRGEDIWCSANRFGVHKAEGEARDENREGE